MAKWKITLDVDSDQNKQLLQELRSKTDQELAFLLNFTESVKNFDVLYYLKFYVQVEINRRQAKSHSAAESGSDKDAKKKRPNPPRPAKLELEYRDQESMTYVVIGDELESKLECRDGKNMTHVSIGDELVKIPY